MSVSKELLESDTKIEIQDVLPVLENSDTEERRRLERKLVWKIDLRMSILMVIYILNYVGNWIIISCKTLT